MSTPRSLEDFADVLRALVDEGLSFSVIGGCAVGAYARLRGAPVYSSDLDIYVESAVLAELLDLATRHGASVVQRPRAREIPVAVVDWAGREVNVLTATKGLPSPDSVARTSREFELRSAGLVVPIADPFDLLANKLAIRRPKDEPHILVLVDFVEDEVIAALGAESSPRARLEPARRLLGVLASETLPEHVVARMIALADAAPIRRFLVHHSPSRAQAEAVITGAPDDERQLLRDILDARTLPVVPAQ